jgi:hypothetical protein
VGFTKFKLIQMVKIDDRFEYQSVKEGGQNPENAFETAYFKTNFLNRLAKDLKGKYA